MFEDDIIKNIHDDGQGYPILSDEEINAGLVFPVVAETLLGTSGTYIMLTLILLAVMSTGSGQASDYLVIITMHHILLLQVIAIASIVIYDIYQPYIQPFKKYAGARARSASSQSAHHCYLVITIWI